MHLLRLSDHRLAAPVEALGRLASEHGHLNVFNPSVVVVDGTWHLAYRAQSRPGEKPFRAFYAQGGPDGFGTPVDLSEVAAAAGLAPTADPKLFTLDGEVYATFNTGYTAGTNNEICVMRLTPEVGPPQRCLLADRQFVEKNWAFFRGGDGVLHAIYTLRPLVLLRLTAGDVGTSDDLKFERVVPDASGGPRLPDLTIGTQLSFADPQTAYLIGHQKVVIGRKRAYLGRPVRVDLSEGRFAVRAGDARLIHSYRALVPPRDRHNPNLISATYFSGLVAREDRFLLGYGINDLTYSFAELPVEALWA